MGDSADKISWKSNQTLDTSPSDVSLENHKKVREERVEVPKARGPGDPPPPFCPSLLTLCTLSSPSQPPPLSQYDPVSTHPFPLSTSLHQPFPLWPPLPVPAAPALPGKWGILAKGAALTRSSPALPSPPPLGRLDHKARAAASGVQQPAPHRRLRTAPPATCAARRPWPRGQHPAPGRATPLSPAQPSGSRRVTMPAPRAAAFLLLHLVLQPWQRAGAQGTPQGKWPPRVPLCT